MKRGAGDRDDNRLVQRVCGGEREAYRAIVERHQARIFYLGLKFFHNPQDAEDFAQDVFLRSYENLSTFRGEVPFGAWLYRLAFNLAVNRYHFNLRRLETMRTESLDGEGPAREAGGQLGPEGRMLAEEFRNLVRSVLKELPDAWQIVLHLHYHEGRSYPEISHITGLPVNTIKSHVFRAKGLLRRRLGRSREELFNE